MRKYKMNEITGKEFKFGKRKKERAKINKKSESELSAATEIADMFRWRLLRLNRSEYRMQSAFARLDIHPSTGTVFLTGGEFEKLTLPGDWTLLDAVSAICGYKPDKSWFGRYEEYLASGEWQKKRSKALYHYGWTCSRCAKQSQLDVHHMTYDRLGGELMSDLEVMCKNCHIIHHEIISGVS